MTLDDMREDEVARYIFIHRSVTMKTRCIETTSRDIEQHTWKKEIFKLKLVNCDGRHWNVKVEGVVVQKSVVAAVIVRAVLAIPRGRPSVRRCGEHRPTAIINRS